MNSPEGKRVLALVRGANYAHPGEEEAIDRVFIELEAKPSRQVLDVGCGRGGTADYFQRRGLGEVTGIDIDASSLAEAAQAYPVVRFVTIDVVAAAERWNAQFDLVYLFNSFYAFADQERALRSLAEVVRNDASLYLFDYTRLTLGYHLPNTFGRPLRLDHLPTMLRRTGWQVHRVVDLTHEYRGWYRELLRRIVAAKDVIEAQFGTDWYEYVHGTYETLLRHIEIGSLGGVWIHALRTA